MYSFGVFNIYVTSVLSLVFSTHPALRTSRLGLVDF